MKIRLLLVYLIPSVLFFGCPRMVVDYGEEPQTIALRSSSSDVKTASNILLTASVLFGGGGFGCCIPASVEFYKDTTLIGTDTTPTVTQPTTPNKGSSSSYDLSVSLTSSQNGTQVYTAKVKFDSRIENTAKTITSSPVSVVVAIP